MQVALPWDPHFRAVPPFSRAAPTPQPSLGPSFYLLALVTVLHWQGLLRYLCIAGKALGGREAGHTSEVVERGLDTAHTSQDLLEFRGKEHKSPSSPSCNADPLAHERPEWGKASPSNPGRITLVKKRISTNVAMSQEADGSALDCGPGRDCAKPLS